MVVSILLDPIYPVWPASCSCPDSVSLVYFGLPSPCVWFVSCLSAFWTSWLLILVITFFTTLCIWFPTPFHSPLPYVTDLTRPVPAQCFSWIMSTEEHLVCLVPNLHCSFHHAPPSVTLGFLSLHPVCPESPVPSASGSRLAFCPWNYGPRSRRQGCNSKPRWRIPVVCPPSSPSWDSPFVLPQPLSASLPQPFVFCLPQFLSRSCPAPGLPVLRPAPPVSGPPVPRPVSPASLLGGAVRPHRPPERRPSDRSGCRPPDPSLDIVLARLWLPSTHPVFGAWPGEGFCLPLSSPPPTLLCLRTVLVLGFLVLFYGCLVAIPGRGVLSMFWVWSGFCVFLMHVSYLVSLALMFPSYVDLNPHTPQSHVLVYFWV